MDEAVTNEVETTTSEASPAIETKTTEEVFNSSGVTTREVNNTPNDNEENTDTVQDYSERSVNRFQDMANRIRELEQQNAQYSQYAVNPQAYGVDPYAAKFAQLESQNMIIKEQQRLQIKQNLFREAEQKFPEMDPSSPKYNQEFDDAVTAMFNDRGISPVDGAKKMRKLLEKATYRAIEDNQVSMENKKASSGNVQNRTASVESDEKRMVTDAYNRFKQSKSSDDYARYLQAKRRLK